MMKLIPSSLLVVVHVLFAMTCGLSSFHLVKAKQQQQQQQQQQDALPSRRDESSSASPDYLDFSCETRFLLDVTSATNIFRSGGGGILGKTLGLVNGITSSTLCLVLKEIDDLAYNLCFKETWNNHVFLRDDGDDNTGQVQRDDNKTIDTSDNDEILYWSDVMVLEVTKRSCENRRRQQRRRLRRTLRVMDDRMEEYNNDKQQQQQQQAQKAMDRRFFNSHEQSNAMDEVVTQHDHGDTVNHRVLLEKHNDERDAKMRNLGGSYTVRTSDIKGCTRCQQEQAQSDGTRRKLGYGKLVYTQRQRQRHLSSDFNDNLLSCLGERINLDIRLTSSTTTCFYGPTTSFDIDDADTTELIIIE